MASQRRENRASKRAASDHLKSPPRPCCAMGALFHGIGDRQASGLRRCRTSVNRVVNRAMRTAHADGTDMILRSTRQFRMAARRDAVRRGAAVARAGYAGEGQAGGARRGPPSRRDRSLHPRPPRLRGRSLGLLAIGRRQAARAKRQAPQQRNHRARRLRADAAAGLHRAAAAARLCAAAPRSGAAGAADPRHRGFSQGRRRAIQLRAGPAEDRRGVQAGLRQGGDRRRPHQGSGGPHLCLRDRRQRHL